MAAAITVTLLPIPADAAPRVDPRPRTSTEGAGERLVFDQHNQARHDPGRFGHPGATAVPALEWDEQLAQVARQWSDTMARDDWMRHNPHFIEQGQLTDVGGGENVIRSGWGSGNTGAAGLTQWWMDSDGHRTNIMQPSFDAVGIGLSIDGRGQVWGTAVFRMAPLDFDDLEPEAPWNQPAPPPPAPLVRDLAGLCPPVDTSRFVDVTRHVDAVECLAEREITLGTSPDRFGPSGTVTRGQMAHFLVATHELLQGTRIRGPSRSWFTDNHSDGRFHREVNIAADLGLAAGTEGRCNHRSPVRRDHMALFLLRLVVAQDDGSFEQLS